MLDAIGVIDVAPHLFRHRSNADQPGASQEEVLASVRDVIATEGELDFGLRNGVAADVAHMCSEALCEVVGVVAPLPQRFPFERPLAGSRFLEDLSFVRVRLGRSGAARKKARVLEEARKQLLLSLMFRTHQRIQIVADTAQALTDLFEADKLSVAAPISVARTSLETGLLLDKSLSGGVPGERFARTAAADLWEYEQSHKASLVLWDTEGAEKPDGPWEKATMTPEKVEEAYAAARKTATDAGFRADDAKKRKFAGKPAPAGVMVENTIAPIEPGTTELAKAATPVLHGTPSSRVSLLWALCSGATHGALWLAGSELHRSATTREFAGAEVMTATEACMTGAILTARAVERYFGLDPVATAELQRIMRRNRIRTGPRIVQAYPAWLRTFI